MNLFKRLFKGGNSKKTIDAIVKSIRESKEFSEGKRCFHYANFGFFCIWNEKEASEYYSLYSEYHSQDMVCFALDNVNADWETWGIIYYIKNSDEVFYQSYYERDCKPIKIANSLNELFGNISISEILISRNDEDYSLWEEENFHSYSVIENVSKCLIPNIDLRIYLKEKFSYFLSSNKEFSPDSFIEFLTKKEKDIVDLIPSDFCVFSASNEELINLIDEINSKSEKSYFKIVKFNPSDFWGIIDMNDISKEDAEELVRLGLVEL